MYTDSTRYKQDPVGQTPWEEHLRGSSTSQAVHKSNCFRCSGRVTKKVRPETFFSSFIFEKKKKPPKMDNISPPPPPTPHPKKKVG